MSATGAWRLALSVVIGIAVLSTLGCSSNDSTSGQASATPQTPVTAITLVMKDNKYETKAFAIPANQAVTVTTDNKGSALHNLHILGVKSTDGKDIISQLIPNGRTEAVTFTIDRPGTYDYRCDVHPEMNGKLTVQ